jgi:hypothetical protein
MFKSRYLLLAFVLFLVWVGAFVVFHVAGFVLRLILILALILLVTHFLTNRKKA